MKKRWTTLLLLLPLLSWASNFSEAMRAFKKGDYKVAKELFELAIEEDGAEQAQYFLGLMYLQGKGVKKSLPEARRYLFKAAELGNARAKCYLAETYLDRKRPDKKKALQLLKEGSAAGAEECEAVAARYNIPL
ncbi:tetratricopeptide repeat protein [Hydrogenimonas sp.]